MSDASSLRNLLRKTDGTAPAIQQAAGAMMKHYDKSPGVAVVEWRNALHQARQDQHLPLLYVANEVLQNSKRNRGNKFLEEFSPILGQALIFISQNQNSTAVVEKIRRVVKIWGDRRVFSIRYVNELLKGLEPHRTATSSSPAARSKPAPAPAPAPSDGGGFSPMAKSPKSPEAATPTPTNTAIDIDKEMAEDDDLGLPGDDDDDDDDSEGDLFGDAGDSLLNIEVDLDRAAANVAKSSNNNTSSKARKRRRPSATGANASGSKSPRRKSILSTSSLMELWSQVSTLQQRYDHVLALLSDIKPDFLDESKYSEQIDTLVGDELLQQYKQVLLYEKRVVEQRKELHSIAQKRRVLESEAVRYLPWMENALKQDQDDIDFCDHVQKQVESFVHVHALTKAARDERLAEEARRQRAQEELQKRKEEEEERKKFLESAMHKETEDKGGMVWNKATGEYQHLHTDESWRD
jgi:hypothetical protein